MRAWRKTSLRDFLRRLISIEENPHRTALAFSLGVFLGFSPFWGLHTLVGLALSFIFRLNRFALLVGVFVNTPWTMAPVASLGTALGFLLQGAQPQMPALAEMPIFSKAFWQETASGFLWPFLMGNIIVAMVAGAVAYFAFRWILAKNAQRRISQHR
jgi:uncharacterized protein (TIGR03546 family)